MDEYKRGYTAGVEWIKTHIPTFLANNHVFAAELNAAIAGETVGYVKGFATALSELLDRCSKV